MKFDPTVDIACRTNVKFKALLEQGMGVVRVLVIRLHKTFASCSQVSEIYSCDRPTPYVSCTSTLCSKRTEIIKQSNSALCALTHTTHSHTHICTLLHVNYVSVVRDMNFRTMWTLSCVVLTVAFAVGEDPCEVRETRTISRLSEGSMIKFCLLSLTVYINYNISN